MVHLSPQRRGMVCAAFILLHMQLGAKKCKTFKSLVVTCALNAGCLSVNNNTSIGGNVSVSGNVTTSSGALGALLAYGSWFNTTSGTISAGTNVTFPTASAANSSNITVDATNSIFTVNIPGKYLVLYQVTAGIVGGNFITSFILQQAPAATGIFASVTGGTVVMTTVDSGFDNITLEISNAIIITVGAGDKFQLLNSDNGIVLDSGPHTGNSAAISFTRIHA